MRWSWRNLYQISQSCHAKGVDLPIVLDRNENVKKKYLLDPFRKDPDKMMNLLFPLGTKYNYLIRLNDYPYDLENGIEHWVLWIKPEVFKRGDFIAGPRLDYRLKRILDEYFEPGNYVYFRNSLKNRTIPAIPHYHIMVKKFRSNPR